MPGQARIGDKAEGICEHRCHSCPHSVSGPATQGSPDVFINGKPAVRKGDGGVHASCCGANTWTAKGSSPTVIINGKEAFRRTDATRHCGGDGILIQASGNVIVGSSQAAGFKKAARSHAPFVCNCNQQTAATADVTDDEALYLRLKGKGYSNGGQCPPYLSISPFGRVMRTEESGVGNERSTACRTRWSRR